jgi:hypothetical protein
VSTGVIHAQIYTTSSVKLRSYTNGGGIVAPTSVEFRTTSVYGNSIAQKRSYSTAPMQVANGSIKTIASTVTGGVLLDNSNSNGGYIPTITPVIPGVPDTPIDDGWDVALLLALLCVGYVVRRYLTLKQVNDK